jgi:hypothetical protein
VSEQKREGRRGRVRLAVGVAAGAALGVGYSLVAQAIGST